MNNIGPNPSPDTEVVMRLAKPNIAIGGRFGELERTAEEITSELDDCVRDIFRFVNQEDKGFDDLSFVFGLESTGDALWDILVNFEIAVRLELCRDEQVEIVVCISDSWSGGNSI